VSGGVSLKLKEASENGGIYVPGEEQACRFWNMNKKKDDESRSVEAMSNRRRNKGKTKSHAEIATGEKEPKSSENCQLVAQKREQITFREKNSGGGKISFVAVTRGVIPTYIPSGMNEGCRGKKRNKGRRGKTMIG